MFVFFFLPFLFARPRLMCMTFCTFTFDQIWSKATGNWSMAHEDGKPIGKDGKCGGTRRCFGLLRTRFTAEGAKGLCATSRWFYINFTVVRHVFLLSWSFEIHESLMKYLWCFFTFFSIHSFGPTTTRNTSRISTQNCTLISITSNCSIN